MTYPDDVLKAAREAAAKYWDTLDAADSGEGYDENARLCRSGECDADPEVQAACIAIMAEREKCVAKVRQVILKADKKEPTPNALIRLMVDIADAIRGQQEKVQ